MDGRIKQVAVDAGLIVAEYNGFDRANLNATEIKFAEALIEKLCYDMMDFTGESDRIAFFAKHYWGVGL